MIAEVALAVILVAGAGWLIRSFDNLRTVNPGFAPDGRMAFDVRFFGPQYRNPNGNGFDAVKVDAAAQDLLSRIRAMNGVVAVGMTSNLPLRAGPENSLYVKFRDEVFDPKSTHNARQRLASPGFFEAMGVGVVSGRDFNGDDRLDTQRVAIVNRTFVRRYMTDREPIGAQIAFGYPSINPQSESTIIGVVEDVRQKSLAEAAEPAIYSSDRQQPNPGRTVIIHSRTPDVRSLQASIKMEVAKVDPQIAVDFTMASDLVESALERQQLGMQLMLVFGAAALALAAVGIYGVIAYAASLRRSEVATRLALGATPASVFRLVFSQGRTLAIVGAVIGLTAAYLSGRLVASRLYEVQAHDPMILAAATITVAGLAFLATAVPAYRASRIDPSRVLRPE
jgi:predicted permease